MFEEKSFLSLLEESFIGIKTNILRCETLGFPWKSKQFLKQKGDEVLSHVGFLEYPMLIECKWHNVAALHAICTKMTHRNQGLAFQLIQEALNYAIDNYEFIVLFTEIPLFYKKLSFHCIQEYRFRLPCQHLRGTQSLRPITVPKDNSLFLHSFKNREPLSNRLWMKDHGEIASFNALFATYPTYWSLYYSPSINCLISYQLEGKTLHLFDIIADKIPSLELILDHFPTVVNEIYFYFSPDKLTNAATSEPYLYDYGYFMVHGKWPCTMPFMISPLSRC